jgi:hypothetical protein
MENSRCMTLTVHQCGTILCPPMGYVQLILLDDSTTQGQEYFQHRQLLKGLMVAYGLRNGMAWFPILPREAE